MAEKSSFFNAVINDGIPDRTYKAEEFARYFSSFIGNGVFPNPSTNLQVIALDNNMNIRVKSGLAWVNGYMYENTDDLILTLDNADGALKRIDRVVIRLDFVNREITCKVKKGAFASIPTAQVLQRDADAYELCVAEITINNGAINISQSNITDTRLNSELCGIVTQTVKNIDTTTLYNQLEVWKLEEIQRFNAWRNTQETIHSEWYSTTTNQLTVDFQTWFDTIKGVLDGDIAGNLANRILELENKVGSGLTANNILMNDGSNVQDAIDANETSIQNAQNDIQNLQIELVNNKTILEANINAIREVL